MFLLSPLRACVAVRATSYLSCRQLCALKNESASSSPGSVKEQQPTFCGEIPIDQLDIKYSRSSGPGGQNVNKTNTKVEVRFHVHTAQWIPEHIREKLIELHCNRITKDGTFVVKSDKTRLQTLNLADCMDKIRCYIREAAAPPPEVLPETLAIIKERQERAAARRLLEKRHKTNIRRMKTEGVNIEI